MYIHFNIKANMFQDLFGKQPLIVSIDIDNEVQQKVKKLCEAGSTAIELLNYSPTLIAQLRHDFPELKIGMGNILTLEQLEKAAELKPDFISSPGLMPSMLKTASIYNLPLMPGISSLSDAMQAMELGYHDCRVCPGDLSLCKRLNQYMPQMKLYPMDIEWDLIVQFLDLPSVAAVGLSNPDDLTILQISESLHI
jgi:2-dehydro-3-deoxyphosphogluconate aldolase/(4S)-4-hydroxy-2-oxoglutarate aldolase